MRTRDRIGDTALHLLAWRQYDILREETARCVNLLLSDPRTDVNAKDGTAHQRTPLMIAVKWGAETMVRKLLQHKDISLGPRNNQGNLAEYVLRDSYVGCLRLLLKDDRISVNALGWSDYTALIIAVQSANVACVRTLLDCPKVDANIRCARGLTPLFFAINGKNVECLNGLLQCPKVDVNIRSSQGLTPLTYAIKRSTFKIVDVLLKCSRVDVNIRESRGNTALHHACRLMGSHLVERILQTDDTWSTKCDVNARDDRGLTALHVCVKKDYLHLASLLVKVHGIRRDLKSDDGRTPLELARHLDNRPMIRLLRPPRFQAAKRFFRVI